MRDPIRLLDAASDASDAERALLEEARTTGRPSSRQREAILAAVLADVGDGSGESGATNPPAAGNGSLGPAAKLAIAAIVAGACVWLFTRWIRPEPVAVEAPPAPSVVATVVPIPSAEVASVTAPPPVVPAPSAAPTPRKTPAVASAPPSASASSTLASRLREESDLIARAREAMRAGDYSSAEAFLATARSKFPNGVLVQERKALEVETLHRSGKRAEAAALGEEFLRTYPDSPHAARIRELLKP